MRLAKKMRQNADHRIHLNAGRHECYTNATECIPSDFTRMQPSLKCKDMYKYALNAPNAAECMVIHSGKNHTHSGQKLHLSRGLVAPTACVAHSLGAILAKAPQRQIGDDATSRSSQCVSTDSCLSLLSGVCVQFSLARVCVKLVCRVRAHSSHERCSRVCT